MATRCGEQRAFPERERRYRLHWGQSELREVLDEDQVAGAGG